MAQEPPDGAAAASTPDFAAIPGRLIGQGILANGVGAALIYLYLQFLAPGAYDPHASKAPGVISLLALVAYLPITAVGTRMLMRTRTQELKALADNPEPSADQRRWALGAPARIGWISAAFWAGAACIFGPMNAAFGNNGVTVARVTIGILLGGLISSVLTATLVERGMRPVLVKVLGGEPVAGRGLATLAIRARLLRAWLIGSAVPLLAVGLTPIARTPAQRSNLVVPVAFLAGFGIVAGLALVLTTATGVSEPLRALRRAVDAVRDGDLTVSVPVDDAGEIGMLEAGVNAMVAGLRERRRLEDLFGRHVGTAVARRALSEKTVLGGELRTVSALFVDLIGSTSLAGSRPPHEVVATLNRMFGAVVAAVTAEGGWVNKFEGDAALCVFGAPEAEPDHAANALRAARRLRAALAALHTEDPALDAGIGVATGAVVAGNIGASDRYEYTIIGDAVNQSARLSELAKSTAGRLLANDAAVGAAGPDEAAHWQPEGEAVLRGRSDATVLMGPVTGLPAPDPADDRQPPATAGTIDTV